MDILEMFLGKRLRMGLMGRMGRMEVTVSGTGK